MAELIYGRNPVLELIKAKTAIERILIAEGSQDVRISEIISFSEKRGIRLEKLTKFKLTEIAGSTKHQGVAAYVQMPEFVEPEQLLENAAAENEPPLVALLDGIEDPHNLGAILRSADGAGLHGVILPKNRAAQITGTVFKTSAGAATHVSTAQVTNLGREIEYLKEKGVWFVGADQSGEKNYTDVDMSGSTGIIVGAEGKGLHRLIKEKCDFLVKIPMFGKINSLNASVAAALLFFEARRQRSLQK